MKATTGFAALATIGLLALTGCLHDGGDDDSLASGPPATTETDMSTATLNDSRSANSAEILDVTAQAATVAAPIRERCSGGSRRCGERFRRFYELRRH